MGGETTGGNASNTHVFLDLILLFSCYVSLEYINISDIDTQSYRKSKCMSMDIHLLCNFGCN